MVETGFEPRSVQPPYKSLLILMCTLGETESRGVRRQCVVSFIQSLDGFKVAGVTIQISLDEALLKVIQELFMPVLGQGWWWVTHPGKALCLRLGMPGEQLPYSFSGLWP